MLPKYGMVYTEEIPQMVKQLTKASIYSPVFIIQVLTKPKILPLKSVTFEKIEEMQKQVKKSCDCHATTQPII